MSESTFSSFLAELYSLWPRIALYLGGVVAGTAALMKAFIPFVTEYLRSQKQRVEERTRIRSTTRLLRAQFGQIGRHSATNLKRLTETFRGARRRREIVIMLTKMSLATKGRGGSDAAPQSLQEIRLEDISLFPEHLARDVLRMKLTTRNIEIDIVDAISLFEEHPDAVFERDEHSIESRRLDSLSSTIERCADDCRSLVVKLKEFERFQFPPGLLDRVLRRTATNVQSYRDEPIHFTDAMSLREAADWVNWKEEQRLIPIAVIASFIRSSLHLAPDESVQVVSQSFGTINSIVHCRGGGADYCLRVRVNEAIFQYEPGLLKEVFVALALRRVSQQSTADEILADIYRKCVANTVEFPPLTFSIGPDIYFGVTRCDLPGNRFPCIITEWFDAPLLAEAMDIGHGFHALGQAIRQLHSIRTSAFYRNLRELGEYRFPRNFSEEIVAEIAKRNDDVQLLADDMLSPLLERASLALSENHAFCLCHNDLHPRNVFWRSDPASPKQIAIVDWDNACISHPYLDFVKVLYWSKIGPDGRLGMDDRLFGRFCSGYGEEASKVKRSPIFLTLCLLWLMRVLMFEKKREVGGREVPRPFQPSAYYERHIFRCARALDRAARQSPRS